MPRRRNQNKQSKNRPRRRNRNRRALAEMSGYRLAVTRNNQLSMPDSMIVDLPFTDTTLTINPAASTFGSFRYRGNSPYDPDPLLGGESALFYTTYSELYRRYRVLSVKVEVTLVNNETFPVYVTMAPTDTDMSGSISSVARVLDLGEYPYAQKPILLPPVGSNNRVTFSKVVHWPKFVGNKQSWMADDLYAALNNAIPANVTYIMFAIAAPQNFSAGVTKYIRLIYRTLWTDRNYQFATLGRVFHNQCTIEECDSSEDDPKDYVMVEPATDRTCESL